MYIITHNIRCTYIQNISCDIIYYHMIVYEGVFGFIFRHIRCLTIEKKLHSLSTTLSHRWV